MRRVVVVALSLLVAALALSPRAAASPARVALQPFSGDGGDGGPSLRKQLARMLHGHGFHVITSIARVDGTGQYLTLARDHRLAAFVTGDFETHSKSRSVTFLVWNGADGSVLARWSASGSAKRLTRVVAKGFWKHLGHALDEAAPPPSNELPPAAPMFINAAEP